MKLTNATILNSRIALIKLKEQDLSIDLSWDLNKNIKALNEKIKFYEERKNDLFKKYGKEDEKGNYFIGEYDEENKEKFFKDLNEMLNIEEEVEIKQFTLKELKENNVKLSSDDVENISFMIKK